MKRHLKVIVVRILSWQTKRLLRRNPHVKVIAVAGSIGKTSTKLAVARGLALKHSVRYQEGNYNDHVTVPLVFFGKSNPGSVVNVIAWLVIFITNEWHILQKYPADFVVLELGTDGPGQIQQFKNYLQADIGIVTAITPEHMEFFGNLDAVANEELALCSFSKQALVNSDLCADTYISSLKNQLVTYGTSSGADYLLGVDNPHKKYTVSHGDEINIQAQYNLLQLPKLYSISAMVAVMHMLELPLQEIQEAVALMGTIQTPGRLSILEGKKNSVIIDDTYNASPEAVKFALDILYGAQAPQKIAILGSMNELGESSQVAHEEIGDYCDPEQLALVVTIGQEAAAYLAPKAVERGCTVHSFLNPYEAGQFVAQNLEEEAYILAKGSQNGVFAEEALKVLLQKPDDQTSLVRQSSSWMQKKHAQFKKL